ncbi:hypothetical protein [Dyadobacter sp. CY312]|uniref:hypothetical protein n=1 Tax=Dyadobacter sp. CY312 TaxID=2907303 RepID=UPI001F228668|nr:hypothetical protein [Dyadobacter sp. CY312]MCE7041326.1 hypothetical protein [Dyadobacter sp. CY312]
MKTDSIHIVEINRLLENYLKEIENSNLKPLSAMVYQVQSKNFVRWINGEFTPGEVKKKTLQDRADRNALANK